MNIYTFRTCNQWLYLLIALLILGGCASSSDPNDRSVESPGGEIRVQVFVKNHRLYYQVEREDSIVLKDSQLGLQRSDADFSKGMSLDSVSAVKSIHKRYEIKTGKKEHRKYDANERIFNFSNKASQKLNIIFRVSNDGVAFRYHFPVHSKERKKIEKEVTSFHFSEDARAWLQPIDSAKTGYKETNPSYEEYYMQGIPVDSALSPNAGWVFPALFKTGSNWIVITEAALDSSYCASRLQFGSPGGNYKIGFPEKEEKFPGGSVNPKSTLPWSSPWRIIAIGDLKTITESTLGTDLAKSVVKMDTSWIKPGRASWSWAKLKDASVNYETQKKFIDYASKMGWEYTLVDVNWDRNIGYERMKKLADYAAKKDVGLILWYNSSGSWNNTTYSPKSKLLTHEDRVKEFSKIEKMGVKGIKVDFFGGDGQSMIRYYLGILKDAAAHHLLVNFHGATLPRGWERTWPNLVTVEAVRGFEYITFNQYDANLEANHAAMLPFTRNVFDPMDFTPMSLTKIPHINRKTTSAFELALPIIFTSGIQHFAETPSDMQKVPEYVKDFLKKIPVAWDDTRFIAGYPAKLVVLARKKGRQWYVAGIMYQRATNNR